MNGRMAIRGSPTARTRCAPNRIALMVVALDRREGNTLHVRHVDALDGSPVVDIEPYVRRIDSFRDSTEGWFAGKTNRPKPRGRE